MESGLKLAAPLVLPAEGSHRFVDDGAAVRSDGESRRFGRVAVTGDVLSVLVSWAHLLVGAAFGEEGAGADAELGVGAGVGGNGRRRTTPQEGREAEEAEAGQSEGGPATGDALGSPC